MSPHGNYYFRDGFVNLSEIDKTVGIDQNGNIYMDTLIKKTDDTLYLRSYFPRLIKNDSSILDHYSPKTGLINLIYETEYSYFLHGLNEPIIYGKNDSRIIRMIFENEVYRLELGSEVKLYYLASKFDLTLHFNIVEKDSCILKEKDKYKIEKILKTINLDKEYYFTEIGLGVSEQYLLEYQNTGKYYAFKRKFFSRNMYDKDCGKIASELLFLYRKYLLKKFLWL